MASKSVQDERMALSQMVTNQPDGPGKRIGKRGELLIFGKVPPGGAKLFRERLPRFQAEAGYWENRIGTVHDFRMTLFDNDTRILIMIIYDGDFKAYVNDIISKGHEWFDSLFSGVWEGFVSSNDPSTVPLVLNGVQTSEFFYAAHPDVTVHDIGRMKRIANAVSEMIDAAN